MKYLSLCSGIEAASVAWEQIGFTPAAFSEISPFPSAVLAHRFPHIKNLGNMLDYEKWTMEPIDIMVGGTPCQAFSVAGKRGSLDDERGNLCLTFCEIADRFDPEWIIWENVPGVLSTKDNAFGCLLGKLCGHDAPIPHTRIGGGHHTCGVVSGPVRTVAWRTLDAQWFGVPQRRRRVFVIAVRGARNFRCADALLPFGEGVPGNLETRRKERKNAPHLPGMRPKGSHWDGGSHPTLYAHKSGIGLSDQELFRQRGAYLVPDVSPSVTCKWAKGSGGPAGDETQNIVIEHIAHINPDVSATIDANYGSKWTGDQYTLRNGFLVFENHAQDSRIKELGDVCCTVSAKYGTGGGNTPIVLSNSGFATFRETEIASTITASCTHHSRYGDNSIHQSENDVTGKGFGEQGDPMYTLTDEEKTLGICCIQGEIADGRRDNQHGLGIKEDISYSILTSSPHCVAYPYVVRRLTPRECERLQGFPDDWTLIPWSGKPADDCSDSHRYKAIGNSMAVPVMKWIGERIIKTGKDHQS